MHAIQVRPPGGSGGDVASLIELLPHVREFVGADWVRLGDAVLRRGAVQARAPQSQLRLVVQHGRLFQQAHPDVRVLSDKGRYLVVEVDPAAADDVTADDFPCFSVREIPWGTTVFDIRERVARQPDEAAVQKCVDALSAEQFEHDLRTLVGFGTRHATSAGFSQAADWAREQLEAAGYHTHTQAITVHGRPSRNVIADRGGTAAKPRDVVIVTAHLDSINRRRRSRRGGPRRRRQRFGQRWRAGDRPCHGASPGQAGHAVHPLRRGRAGAVRQPGLCRDACPPRSGRGYARWSTWT